MRLWFDILTPKQVNFFKPIIDELRRDHEILCTSRAFRETIGLAKIRGLELEIIGEYGFTLYDKLVNAGVRIQRLAEIINDYKPDKLVTFSSPDACRVAFGLKIPIICFNDSPHAEAVCRLSIPLVDKLMHSWIIPTQAFVRYGIDKDKITVYRALDPALWIREVSYSNGNTILFRFEESKAAYLYGKRSRSIELIKELSISYKINVLYRYEEQRDALKDLNCVVIQDVVDGLELLSNSAVFIGSGGTMNCEAALLGIPNMIYNMQDIYVNRYLIDNKLSYILDYNNIAQSIEILLKEKEEFKERSKNILRNMEDLKTKIVNEITKKN
ncbi:MAG: DUF354 domain-containing protein [Candidatus Nitrosocaldaceae archaeon]